jgi:methylmalonyl-CoA epimerase
MRIHGIHHITRAVRDAAAARAAIASLLGAEAGPIDAIPAFGVRSTDVALGDDTLQLVSPLDDDNPVMRYIERRGEGFYALALEVDDIDAAVAELAERGVRVSAPVESAPGLRSAFVAMAATHGLSVQLVEATHPSAANGAHAEPDAGERQPVPLPVEPLSAQPPAEPPPAWPERPQPVQPPHAPLDLTPDEWSEVD